MANMHTNGHGQSKKGSESGAYKSWSRMKVRCLNKNDKSYQRYGGIGITVCDRLMSFENFYADMGDRPDGMTLDRINNNGNYEPSNCRWATKVQQQANRKNAKLITCLGQSMTAKQWELQTGVDAATLTRRINRGIPPEVALSMEPIMGRRLKSFVIQQEAV